LSLPNDIQECPSDNGIIEYLNIHAADYHSKSEGRWSPCSDIYYDIDSKGSIAQYKRIRLNSAVKIWLYNGDWDDVVPYPDTLKNLEKMNIRPVGVYKPWFVGEDHAGFFQLYDELTVITVKGAGHMVPENKREAAFQMFYNFINGRPVDTPVY
jgi:serine carboxypeptidase-like clade 2